MFTTSVLLALALVGTGSAANVGAMPEQPPQPKSPSIVVHRDGPAPANTSDRRVEVSDGVKISAPPAGPIVAGAIRVPDNTMGPGEPLWVRRGLENAAVWGILAAVTNRPQSGRAILHAS